MATSIVCLDSVYHPLSVPQLSQIRSAQEPNPLATPGPAAVQPPVPDANGTLSASAVFSAVAVAASVKPQGT